MVAAGAETSEADRLRAALLRPIQFAGKPATIDAVVVGHNVGRDDLFHELKGGRRVRLPARRCVRSAPVGVRDPAGLRVGQPHERV